MQSILVDRYIHRREIWVVSLKSWSSAELKIQKIFFDFCFFRSYRGLKFCVKTGYLLTFSVIFLQIIFSIKIVFQTKISCQKMNQFCVLKRLKALKKTSSGLIGWFNFKKKSNSIWELFFIKYFYIFSPFLSHLETSDFSYRSSVMKNLFYCQMKPSEQKNRFQGIAHVFLA